MVSVKVNLCIGTDDSKALAKLLTGGAMLLLPSHNL